MEGRVTLDMLIWAMLYGSMGVGIIASLLLLVLMGIKEVKKCH